MAEKRHSNLIMDESSWNEVKAHGLGWIDFYKEFANKLLPYKNNRTELIELIKKVRPVYDEIEPNFPKLDSTEEVMDVDPFTVFELFNKKYSENNIKRIREEMAKVFEIGTPVPDKVDGVPLLPPNSNTFYAFSDTGKRGDDDIDNLWDLFEATLALAENHSKANRQEFLNCYKNVWHQQEIGPHNLTAGLFWVGPNYFLPLDTHTRAFITNTDNMPVKFVTLAKELKVDDDKEKLKAEDYLKVRDDCEKVLKSGEYIYKTLPELSYVSWYVNKNNKKTDKENDNSTDVGKTGEMENENSSKVKPEIGGKNILYYGVPGAGKSYKIDQIIEGSIGSAKDSSQVERVVFHPDYTYSDFVGQILPKLIDKEDSDKKELTYEFFPGPFTRILEKAVSHKNNKYYLVIEELNRGNAPAIFGDIFQLLDRSPVDGEGKYSITNYDVAKAVHGDKDTKISLPSNLYILATMNTSDQNVFTLDTAFQRRWEMELVPNDVFSAAHSGQVIEGSEITWGIFASVVNERVLLINRDMLSSEDKRLGAYFVKAEELAKVKFSQKVLKYLWDDAFKMNRNEIFNEDFLSFEDIVSAYNESSDDPLQTILMDDLYNLMIDQLNKGETENTSDSDSEGL